MNLLLDAHALIWFLNGDSQLSAHAQSLIESFENRKFVSIATLWEISIKIGLGKLEFDGDIKEITEFIENNNFEILPIAIKHTIAYQKLNFIHKDPFDRILIIQAILDDKVIMTKDENIHKYDVITKW